MAQTTMSVSVSMPIWMYQELQEESDKHDIKFSTYLQEVVRDHGKTPLDPMTDPVVCVDENGEIDENGSYQDSEGAA